jgi:transcriptional regulator with XRE-family HTH domain
MELRFLRTVAGLSAVALADELEVTFNTILTWETCEALRYPNDLALRMVIATLSFGEDLYAEVIRVPKAILNRATEPPEISAQWLQNEERRVLMNDEVSFSARRR